MIESVHKKGPIVLVLKDVEYSFPFGYAYLASYLIEKGEKVEILFRPSREEEFESFAEKLISLNPVLVGFGTLYPDLYPIKKIIKLLNEKKNKFPVVVGGQMVTPTPEFAVNMTGADIGVIGEGEIILFNLVSALRKGEDVAKVPGLVINNGEKVIFTGPGEFIKDITKLPKLLYRLLPASKWLGVGKYYIGKSQPHWRYNDKAVAIHGGRGCPFNCNFCYHHSLPRYRPIQEMFKEIGELLSEYNPNVLCFADDLALATPNRAKELVAAIRGLGKKVEYMVSCRFDILERLSDEILKEMKATGCRTMGLGIESGSQRILNIIDKRITKEQILKGMRRLKDAGILPSVSIMVGQYTETKEDVEKSINLMLQTLDYDKNVNYAFTITTPFPGTQLYNLALEKGFLKDHLDFYNRFDADKEINGISVNLSAMTDDEVIEMHKKIKGIYLKRKRELIGRKAAAVEWLRYFVYRAYNKISLKLINKLPDSVPLVWVKNAYHNCHDLFQLIFDKWRLYLYGIK